MANRPVAASVATLRDVRHEANCSSTIEVIMPTRRSGSPTKNRPTPLTSPGAPRSGSTSSSMAMPTSPTMALYSLESVMRCT